MAEYNLCPACGKPMAIKWGRLNIGPQQRYRSKNSSCGITFHFDKGISYPKLTMKELIPLIIEQKKREIETVKNKIKKINAQKNKKLKQKNILELHLSILFQKKELIEDREKQKQESLKK